MNINTADQCSDQCENDNISDDVIDGVINCTSVMRKCLFVNKSGVPMVDVNICTVQKGLTKILQHNNVGINRSLYVKL